MLRNLSDNGDISDETDSTLSSKLGGKLAFEETTEIAAMPNSSSNSFVSSLSSMTEPMESRKLSGTPIIFEIVSYKTVEGVRKKYVVYTLIIKRTPGLEQHPAVIEKRYSEFLDLFLSLRRNFPEQMHPVTYFPKKTVVGNFKPEVIESRSRAFEQFLYHVYNNDQLRFSNDVANFFYTREVKEARGAMKCGKFEDAIPILENAFCVQEKILGECHTLTLSTLCEVIALHNALNNAAEANKFAEIALKMFQLGHGEESEFYPSLLQLMIRLRWNLGHENHDLENKLHNLTKSGIRINNLPTLLDIVMKKCK